MGLTLRLFSVGLPGEQPFMVNIMEYLDSIKNIIMNIMELLFVSDTGNPFFVMSMFIVISIITLGFFYRSLYD